MCGIAGSFGVEVLDREAIRGLLDEDYLEDSLNKFMFSFISCKLFLETCADGA